MKTALCMIIVLVSYCAITIAQEYTSKFDNIDIKEILNSSRLLQNYANCLLNKGKCTPEGEELKSHIKEALDNGCAKCSEKHKAGIRKVIKFLSKKKPDIWKELEDKYDPDRTYRKKYADLIEQEGVQE